MKSTDIVLLNLTQNGRNVKNKATNESIIGNTIEYSAND